MKEARGTFVPTPLRGPVLVTGAAGFIGHYLVEALLKQQVPVVGFDIDIIRSRTQFEAVRHHPHFTFIAGDICDIHAIQDACAQVEVVVHLAALTSVAESVREPRRYHEVNVGGTEQVLKAAVQAKVSRVVFASSGAVYGTPERVPISEEMPLQPLSPYGASKVAAERVCQTVAAKEQLEVPQLRFFNVYGPRQSAQTEAGVVRIFLERAQQGLPLIIYGDGHQTRDFIFIEDAIEALLRAATCPQLPSVPINVGTGVPVSIRELAETIQDLVPSCVPELQFEPPRPGDIYHSVAAIERMQQLLGFTPRYSLRAGIQKICEFAALSL